MPTAGKLGRAPARLDRRTLKLRDYLTVPMPPTQRKWDHGIVNWGAMLNDQIGDCTIAAIGHAIQLVTANTAGESTLPDSAILTAYEAVSGYNPATGANDNGANMLDVMRYWQSVGVGGRKSLAYASCSTSDLDDVRACINLFGFCDLGFNVPDYAIQQFENGQPWSVLPGQHSIVGGHDVIAVDYDPTSFRCVTWGGLQTMTLPFWQAFVDEAFGVVLPEWVAANGQSPSGLNLQQLLADVGQLTTAPTPAPVVDPYQDLYDWLVPAAQWAAANKSHAELDVIEREIAAFRAAYPDADASVLAKLLAPHHHIRRPLPAIPQP